MLAMFVTSGVIVILLIGGLLAEWALHGNPLDGREAHKYGPLKSANKPRDER